MRKTLSMLALAVLIGGCGGGGSDGDTPAGESPGTVVNPPGGTPGGFEPGPPPGVVTPEPGTPGPPPVDPGPPDNPDPGTDPSDPGTTPPDPGGTNPPPAQDPPGTWRSALFPRDWLPLHAGGQADAQGRYLPDFSYAGWHRGEARPPVGQGAATVRVSAPNDGTGDATAAIQGAINQVCQQPNGGVVLLPAGTYRLRVPAANVNNTSPVISIGCSHLVLRGEGPNRTRLLLDDPTNMRQRSMIRARGNTTLNTGTGGEFLLAADVTQPTREITLAAPPSFGAGDWIVIRNDNTAEFRAEHRMGSFWPLDQFPGLFSIRQVESVNGTRVTLDAPIQYTLLMRDKARAYRLANMFEEVGLESFSIGMVENTKPPSGTDERGADTDYEKPGTPGYDVHFSRAIEFTNIHDAWIHDVDSFKPDQNTRNAHLLSTGILLDRGATRITISNSDLKFPQYRGGGGNGYLFLLQGQDALVIDSTAEYGRHNFIISQAGSGNVIRRVTSINARASDDSHRYLARANLLDRVILDSAWLQAVNRGDDSTGAGFTATQNVFWGTHAITIHPTPILGRSSCVVESVQWGFGYLIGSSADGGAQAQLCTRTVTNGNYAAQDPGDPEDFVEGEGLGKTLWPLSLHGAQLEQRCARESRACTAW